MGEAGAWSYILVSFLATLGLLFSAQLFFSRENALPSKSLAAVLFCFSIIGVNYGLISTNFFVKYPQFWRAPAFVSLVLPVFSYKYVVSVLRQQYRFSYWDSLYLIPAILYCFNFYPFFVLPKTEKVQFISMMLENKRMISLEIEGVLPRGWGIRFRLFYGMAFSIGQFYHLFNHKKMLFGNIELFQQNKEIFRWLIYYTCIIFMSYGFILIWQWMQFNSANDFYIPMTFTIGGSISFICVYLFFKPNILYGLAGFGFNSKEKIVVGNFSATTMKENENEVGLTFTADQQQNFHNLIETHFISYHPFTKVGYKIRDLSAEIGLPIYILSAFINQAYGKNFNEFVNDHRIEYISTKILSSPDYAKLTLEAIANLAGFNSRTSFIAAVKKKTGQTPSAYFFNDARN